jgi:hypothetical protein
VPRRQDDVHRNFAIAAGSPFTNSVQPIYAAFTVNFTNLPAVGGAYFAHFYTNSSTFNGRIWGLVLSGPHITNAFRLGISGGSAAAVNKVFPQDLATNIDYHVVAEIDAANQASYLWINPINQTDPSIFSSDTTGFAANLIVNAFAFRQATGFGGFTTISNLTLATTWDEAATNSFSTNATAPIIVTQPLGRTNFVGDNFDVTVLAAGQNMTTFQYQWRKDGGNITNPNGNTNVLSLANAQLTDAGGYDVIVTDGSSLMATSAVASVTISNVTFPPVITTQPATNTVVYTHQSASLGVGAYPNSGISYAWYTTNSGSVSGNPQITGDGTFSITISDIQPSNNTTGAYYVVASNPFGSVTSVLARVSVTAPPSVSIAYLRSLVSTNLNNGNLDATNSTSLYTVTGIVTTYTNLTTGDTASYYLQDSTAGINIFTTFGSTFRPTLGDVVNFIGFLSTFQGTLELEADLQNNPATGGTILSNNIAALPAPQVIPYNVTNNNALTDLTLEGRYVMLTNVYFGTNAGALTPTNASGNVSLYIVTNAVGQKFYLAVAQIDPDTANQTLPSFAYSIRGALTQNTNDAIKPGYQIAVSKWSDIVTDAPPAPTITAAHAGKSTTLGWDSVPYDYSYTVLAAPTNTGPYVPIQTFQAPTRGMNEVPPNPSTATGFGTVALSPDQTTITVNYSWTGLSAPASAAHIHGPAGPGTNASVLFGFSGVPAATSGSIPEQTFAINATQLGYLTNGLLYMNIHNATYPNGEMRAQVLPAPSVGLTFTTTNAVFKDVNAAVPVKFYRLVSP